MAFGSRTDRATTGGLPVGVVLGASVLCHALAAGPAAAQSGPVEQRIVAAHRLLQDNHCDEAAVAFAAIWEQHRIGRALAELALAEACSTHWVEAEHDLSQALGTADPWVAENGAVLSENLESMGAHLATLIVDASGPAPDATQIVLNGQRRGNAGAELRVVAGTVVIEVRATGFASMRRTVELSPRQRARERFELVAEPAAVEAPPVRAAVIAPTTPAARREHRNSGGGMQRTLGWVGLGVGGLSLGVGAVGYAIRESNLAVWNDDARCNHVPGLDRDQECPDEGSAWRTGNTLMLVGLIGGGIAVVGGLTLLLTAPSSPPEERIAFSCGPLAGGASCQLTVW